MIAVIQLLEQYFTELVDYAFTARMEDELDGIAQGQVEREPWLNNFWFGVDVEQVRLRADERHQRHHDRLADRIDRRVGDLREQLLEVGE